jgi:cell wall-associated NlpC family hydrolase
MPNLLRSLLLACAFAALVFGSAVESAAARLPGPSRVRHDRGSHKPTVGLRAARVALKAVGVPYRWGGSSPRTGFDCSGLVYWAYRRVGIELPHSSYALYGRGRRVSRSRLKAGDLLFFYGLGHVGIYVGRGRMVHAPHSGTLVQVVRLGRSGYGGRLVGARRVAHA